MHYNKTNEHTALMTSHSVKMGCDRVKPIVCSYLGCSTIQQTPKNWLKVASRVYLTVFNCVLSLQSMGFGNEDLMDLTRATQQEVRLAAGARSLAARWERDVVYLSGLFNPVIKHHHRLRLLKCMDLEASATTQSIISGALLHFKTQNSVV